MRNATNLYADIDTFVVDDMLSKDGATRIKNAIKRAYSNTPDKDKSY